MKTRVSITVLCMVFLGLVTFTAGVLADDYYVDVTNGNDSYNGQNWTDAKATISAAMALVNGYDTIHVAAGIYYEKVSFPGSFNNQLLGGYPSWGGERDPWKNATIIDGSTSVTSGAMVYVPLQPDGSHGYSGIVIDGFTIRNGTNTGYGCAGIQSYSLGVTIRKNIIEDNQATGSYGLAGGIYIFGPLYDPYELVIEENIIRNNTATGIGGIYLEGASGKSSNYSASLVNNLIYGNESTNTGGIWNSGTGGINILYPAGAEIINCTIAGNTAAHPTNAIGGLHITGFESWEQGIVTMFNSIIWHPDGDDIYVDPTNGSLTMTYSDVEDAGDAIGTGMISEDPLFAGLSDYYLTDGSPCIDTGTSNNAPDHDLEGISRPQDDGYDMGTYEYILQAVEPCEGNFDGDTDVDEEDLNLFASDYGLTDCASSGTCNGDFDEDGDVDGTDLVEFVADFGRTDCPCKPMETLVTTTQAYYTGYYTSFYFQTGNNLFEEADGTLHVAYVENYELYYLN